MKLPKTGSVCLSKYRELLDYFGKKITEALPR